jgi:hypothetical protein
MGQPYLAVLLRKIRPCPAITIVLDCLESCIGLAEAKVKGMKRGMFKTRKSCPIRRSGTFLFICIMESNGHGFTGGSHAPVLVFAVAIYAFWLQYSMTCLEAKIKGINRVARVVVPGRFPIGFLSAELGSRWVSACIGLLLRKVFPLCQAHIEVMGIYGTSDWF